MFLLDSNVISETRKGHEADRGVVDLISQRANELFLPVQVIGELQSGITILLQRGDLPQAMRVEQWFEAILIKHSSRILTFDLTCARRWGVLRGSSEQNQIDKQIAAVALVYDLTVVTRNISHFAGTGVRLLNPFLADMPSEPMSWSESR
jgi:toxin FitB